MMNTKEFAEFCYHQHDVECNQKYSGVFPYSAHLKDVERNAVNYTHLLSPEERDLVIMGAAGHDLIEDARISYNDIKDRAGIEVAEIIFLCTEDKGRNRLARKSKDFYMELKTNRLAVYVKLCDIMANTQFSKMQVSSIYKSSMYQRYKSEWIHIKEYLYTEEFKEMFEYLDTL